MSIEVGSQMGYGDSKVVSFLNRNTEDQAQNIGKMSQKRRQQGSKFRKMMSRQRSWTSTSEMSREEAWVKRRGQLLEEEKRTHQLLLEEKKKKLGRSVSDLGDRWRRSQQPGSQLPARTRGVTDEDVEELRGCIDLGFRFSFDEDPALCNTFPALDLYYAINRQFNVSKSKSSPDWNSLQQSDSFSSGSPSSQFRDTWKISSPGEDSQEVKTKLRQWAQVVACSARQCLETACFWD